MIQNTKKRLPLPHTPLTRLPSDPAVKAEVEEGWRRLTERRIQKEQDAMRLFLLLYTFACLFGAATFRLAYGS